jgi:hypothetical protein
MNSRTIDITIISGRDLVHKKTDILENIVYNNFIHLASHSRLSHNAETIHRLFNSELSFFMSASIDGSLIGYILGEYMNLNHINDADNRNVCYISYIYVCDRYRGKSIATNMMKILFSDSMKINGWMLVFDTHKKNLRDFYSKLGFKPDILHKTHSQHDVYFKQKLY